MWCVCAPPTPPPPHTHTPGGGKCGVWCVVCVGRGGRGGKGGGGGGVASGIGSADMAVRAVAADAAAWRVGRVRLGRLVFDGARGQARDLRHAQARRHLPDALGVLEHLLVASRVAGRRRADGHLGEQLLQQQHLRSTLGVNSELVREI